MGVELASYRARIGNFVHRTTAQAVSNTDYLLKAIASVRHAVVRSWRCKGTVPFIDLLLLAQGVEPNPGPGVKEKQSSSIQESQSASYGEETSGYTERETTSSYHVPHNVNFESPPMRSEAHSSDGIVQAPSSITRQGQINLERGQLEEMEYNEETTSPKQRLPETNTDNRGYQTGGRIPFIQTITAGASGHEIEHWSEEAIGKMVSDSLQGGNTEAKKVAVDQTQGGATGTMMPAYPQGGATGTMVPANPQGGATGTMMPANPQGGATWTMMPANPQGGATGTMIPAYPQEGTTLVQVQKQRISNLNFSFSGGEANMVGDNNTVTINRTDDETKAKLTDIQEMLSKMNLKTQRPSQKTSATLTKTVPRNKERDTRHDKSGEDKKEELAKRRYSEDAAENTITKFIEDTEEVLVQRRTGIQAVCQRLKDYSLAIITGVTGEGKTTLAAQILKDLRDGKLDSAIEAKTPLQLFVPEDWTSVVDAKEESVVFVDDIFGTSNYQADLLNRWKPFFKAISQCLEKKKVMLLLTSRTHILTDARHDTGITDDTTDHILSEKNVVDITNKYQLTSEEQKYMLGNYSFLNQRENDFNHILSLTTPNRSIGFPQQNQRVDSGCLAPLTMRKDDREMLKVYAEACGVENNNHTAVLKKALTSLTRTYLSKVGTVYTFSHESVAENVCLVFGSENPEITLKKCSNRVILELLDFSQADQSTKPRMHVPETCFDILSKRIYEMVTKSHLKRWGSFEQEYFTRSLHSWGRITLESFSRFQNQKFADHFFEYLSKRKLTKEIITVHDSRQSSLLSACTNNVAFLSALYQSKVDMISQLGALRFTACVQEALLQAFSCKNTLSVELLLKQGAVFDTACLGTAFRYQSDKNITNTILFGNIWTTSELKEEIRFPGDKDPKVLQNVRCEVSKLKQRLCNIKPLHTNRQQEQSKQTKTDVKQGTCFQRMFTELLATKPKSESREAILKAIFDSKGKKLSDVICIRRTLGSLDTALIQYALHRCDADTVRFLVLSTKLTTDQLNTMLSQQVYTGHLTNIEILCKAGGTFYDDDFIQRSGTCGYIVSETVNVMATFGQFSAETLSDALKSALCSGSKTTISTLRKHGAKYDLDVDTIHKVVCRRDVDVIQTVYEYIDTVHVSIALNAAVRSGLPILVKNLLSRGGIFNTDALIDAVYRTSEVLEMVKIVANKGKWPRLGFTRALDKAVEICRPDVVIFLHENGGQFSNDSLLNVLKWNVEHCSLEASIQYMLDARKWSESQIRTALVESVKKIFVSGESGKNNWLTFVKLMLYRKQNIPVELQDYEEKRIDIFDIIKVLEKQQCSNDDVLVAILNRSVQNGCVEVAARLLETGTVCGDDSLVDSVCSEGTQGGDKLRLVRLVRTSRDWSDSLQTDALNKALQCGYQDIVMFLHENGTKFGDNSISHAIPSNSYPNDSFPLVHYVMQSLGDCRPSHKSLSVALMKTIDCGYYQLMVDLHKWGAKFQDGSLLKIVCKRWKPVDRMKAVEYVCKSRQWPSEELNESLFEAVKFGDLQMTKCIVSVGARFFDKCLTETMERKMKPSHRLCMIKLVISGQSISKEEISRASNKAAA